MLPQKKNTEFGQPLPPELANRKIGRFASSPQHFQSEIVKQRDDLLQEFTQQHELSYLKDQVRRLESPDSQK